MCPEFKFGICEIAGIEPEHVECADKSCCYSNSFETCRLFLLEALMKCNKSLDLVA